MAAPATILVVEDEPAIAESVAYALRREGYATEIACDCASAWDKRSCAQLVVLDLMLPDGSGLELITRFRRQPQSPAIIVLSSRDSEGDRVAALDEGADDYVTKPFSPREVVARVRAVLRRATSEDEVAATDSPPALRVDRETRRARYGDQALDLTRVEFDLLAEMAAHPERVFARSELIDRVWGDGFAITDRTIDSHIKSLRRKVTSAGGSASLIETVRGVGYRVLLNPTTDLAAAADGTEPAEADEA